jgi:hypothetical protein
MPGLSPEEVDRYLLDTAGWVLPLHVPGNNAPILDISPSLPKDFPHSLLPDQHCEH